MKSFKSFVRSQDNDNVSMYCSLVCESVPVVSVIEFMVMMLALECALGTPDVDDLAWNLFARVSNKKEGRSELVDDGTSQVER